MAKYKCPVCSYSTQVSANMDKHKRDLKHDGVARKASRVGMQPQGKKKGK